MQNLKTIFKLLKLDDYKLGVYAAGIFYNDEVSDDRMKSFLADSHNYFLAAVSNGRVISFAIGYRLDN
ncbi:hypothetical protein KKB18_09465 [bacterium]|nr:hypothetical protein [bacterium]